MSLTRSLLGIDPLQRDFCIRPESNAKLTYLHMLNICAQSAADQYRQQAHDTWSVAAMTLFLLLETDGTALRELPCMRSCGMEV